MGQVTSLGWSFEAVERGCRILIEYCSTLKNGTDINRSMDAFAFGVEVATSGVRKANLAWFLSVLHAGRVMRGVRPHHSYLALVRLCLIELMSKLTCLSREALNKVSSDFVRQFDHSASKYISQINQE